MRLLRAPVKRKARIEIVPLIDIIFFLLATFVMVSLSMIKNQGIPVNLPTASTSAPQERAQSITVSVTKAGEIYLEKELLNAEELKTRLSLVRKDKEPHVFIHADEEADFKHVMRVMDTIRGAGITKVAMQTRPAPAG